MAIKKKAKSPTKAEIAKLRKELNAVTEKFFANYGGTYDFVMMGPPGPRPPPKIDWNILNLSSY
ncbi:MAG TPA: hypothetical protein VMF52_03260 [Steroidobacteraceae bacterium]|nr:hypothetical protein [Steroidobacteraceae bacterium]